MSFGVDTMEIVVMQNIELKKLLRFVEQFITYHWY